MTRLSASMGRFFTCFARGKENGVDESPEVYLQLTTRCMEQARTMSVSPSLKFNHGQCKYLVDKLEVSIQSARPLLGPQRRFDHAGLTHYLQVFKFLFSLSKEVESFIEICCRDSWIEAAVTMTNVSKHVSSVGLNLEVFTIVFSESKEQNGRRGLTLTKVARASKAEVETVEKEACRDEIELRRKVNSFIESSKSIDRWDLPHFLLERLGQSSAPILPRESSPSNLSEGFFTSLKHVRQLGKGSFATVYEAKWLGVSVAKKTFIGQDNAYFAKEFSIFTRLSHPNIIRLFGYRVEKGTCSIVMEMMDGDLYSLVTDRLNRGETHDSPFTILGAVDIMYQVANGVFYLHENHIVHRDLKSHNILYKCVKADDMETAVHIKVADFGLSKIKERSRTFSYQTPNMGTDRWMAPEVILLLKNDNQANTTDSEDSLRYPFKSDVYSFAMVCYEILTGLAPFYSAMHSREVKNKVLAGLRPQLSPDHCPIRLKALIEKCWSHDAAARPSFGDICEELGYLKCLLTNRFIDSAGKLRGVISISIIAKAGPVAEVTAVARNSKTEIGRGEFGPIYYEDLPDRQEVQVLVADGSHSEEKEFFNSEGQILFKGVKMDVGAVLKIIRNFFVTADNACVNKNQCKRLAERFGDIGKALEALITQHNKDIFFETSVMDQILMVLQKGGVLARHNAEESKVLENVLYRAEEAFKEIYEEIDTLGTYLDLGQTEKSTLLSSDAETDRVHPKLHNLILEDIPKASGSTVDGDVEDNVENMEDGVTQKCYNAESNAEDLSYLNIPFSAFHLEGAIMEVKPLSERKSQADAHLDDLALEHKGRWNGCDCAIKVFKSAENSEELQREIASLVKLRHPHITQLFGLAQHDNKSYVLYEMMDPDWRALNLTSRKKERPFSRTQKVSIITQIAGIMFYLHEQGLVHGELKLCTNFLVKERGDHIDVKVTGFHRSRQLGQAPTTKYKPAHRLRWMPPEAFQYYNVDQLSDDLLMKGDVYSFAMTCYKVVTGKYPFDRVEDHEVLEYIKAGERPELPEDLSEDLRRLITKCWHQDPEQRPSFRDICYVFKVLKGCEFANVLEGTDWSDLFPELNSLKMFSIQEIDDAAKKLPHYLKIKPLDLKPLRLLGKGASAEVFEASWIGCRFAVKWLKVDHVIKLRQEVNITMKLLHPHVIRLVGFSVLFNRCAIVMELMDMSLRDFMDSRIGASKEKHPVPFSESEALGVIIKMALGMDFLHSRGVIHGDLKCVNVLVRHVNLKSLKWDVKIGGFGLSHWIGERRPFRQSGTGGWWRAPEVILGMESKAQVDIDAKAADVYSFAMVCYEVITGKKPFEEFSYDTAKALATAGGGPKLDNINLRPELKCLLKDCWSKPDHRPKFEQIAKRLTRMS